MTVLHHSLVSIRTKRTRDRKLGMVRVSKLKGTAQWTDAVVVSLLGGQYRFPTILKIVAAFKTPTP
jgi:hypothetical protein